MWQCEYLSEFFTLSIFHYVLVTRTSSVLILPLSTLFSPIPTLLLVERQDARFVTALELAVRFGKTLIVSECDRIEPMLVPLLRRDAVVQGPRRMVPLGDKLVDFAPGFRLVLATRSPAPDLQPDTRALVTEVNFTVTASGLEAQVGADAGCTQSSGTFCKNRAFSKKNQRRMTTWMLFRV